MFHDKSRNNVVLVIPTGCYEIEELEEYIKQELRRRQGISEEKYVFSLKANKNTLQCEIKSIFGLNFAVLNSLGSCLGFQGELEANKTHISSLPVNITKVRTIRVNCNITTGAYFGNRASHTLYQFLPTVAPGYSINIEPKNIIYLPITSRREIGNITVSLLDQNSELVDIKGEYNTIHLELKKL